MLSEVTDHKAEVLPGKKNLCLLPVRTRLCCLRQERIFFIQLWRNSYLSGRARLDIITAVGFLCTRVQAPTEEDRLKLRRLLGYLIKTKKRVLVL